MLRYVLPCAQKTAGSLKLKKCNLFLVGACKIFFDVLAFKLKLSGVAEHLCKIIQVYKNQSKD